LKIVARWRYYWCTNARENFQNLRKWVQSVCAPLRPFRSEMKENFYNCLLPHILQMCIVHPCENILLLRYMVPQKLLSSQVVPKTVDSATVCAHRNAIMPYIKKNVLEAFYSG